MIYQENATELYQVITLNYIKILLLLLRYRKNNTTEFYQAIPLNYIEKNTTELYRVIPLNPSRRNCYRILLRQILPSSIKGDTAKILSRQNYIHCNIAKNLAIIVLLKLCRSVCGGICMTSM